MDNHKKYNPIGVENNGSQYLCHKCGWNFHNPHPSAKHRRAHKRICGKIDGYNDKVVDDLEEPSQLIVVSDDDSVLYEDLLTPSPKPETSEDNVFVDSVMEISESGMNTPGKSEQSECVVEEAVAVVVNATERQLKVDTAEDCIENQNIVKEDSLKHNLDVLETSENHLGRTTHAASEEIASVATPSLEKTSVEITAFNIAPSNIEVGDTKVDEDRNLGSVEVQDFSTEVESHHDEEDNSSADDSVQVVHTKEANEVNLEEDVKNRETFELEKSPQNLSSFEDTLLNGKDENSVEILPPHGSNDYAEFSSTADDDAIAFLAVSDIEKEGNLRHNLDETPILELGNITASEEMAFADSTSAIEHVREFVIERDIEGVEYGTTTTHNLGFVAEQSTKPVVEVPLQDHLSTEIGMSHQEEEDSSPADDSVRFVHTKGNDSRLTMAEVRPNENNSADNLKMIPESDFKNQIEKVVDKKQDILLDGKLSRDDDVDEMEMIPQIPSEMVVDKHLSEEPKLSRDDDEMEMISQIPSEMVVDKRMSEDSISNNNGNSVVNGVSSVINEFLSSVESQNNHLLLAKQQQFDGSSSQGEDSVEGIWGSISVLSTQSDHPQQCLNTTVPLQPDSTDKSNNPFQDPPSSMTLVEDDHPLKNKQQQILLKTEEPKSQLVLQAAAFPSQTNTNIAKESAGRKKNEEIISKIANWSMAKQHTPLKSLLLSETNLNSSPNWKKQQQTEEENSSSLMKKSDDAPPPLPPAGKGWNSPARYPKTGAADDETKKEKRKKVKGRPNWIQCVCCSSVH